MNQFDPKNYPMYDHHEVVDPDSHGTLIIIRENTLDGYLHVLGPQNPDRFVPTNHRVESYQNIATKGDIEETLLREQGIEAERFLSFYLS